MKDISKEELQQEIQEQANLIEKLSDILNRISIALKGEPPELVSHSWHDLPEIAQALRNELAVKPAIIEIESTPVEIDFEKPTAKLNFAITMLLNMLDIPYTDGNGTMLGIIERIGLAQDKCYGCMLRGK